MSWFSRKPDGPQVSGGDRYSGKPLLVVLENYVLDCIGCFPNDKRAAIVAVVKQVFGGDDDWKTTVRANLQLNESIDDHIRQMWERNKEIAFQTGQTLLPVDFAKMIVDENFSSLIE